MIANANIGRTGRGRRLLGNRSDVNYDASGRRLRKVWITNSGTWRRERIYLGGFEIWRRYDKVGGNWVLDDERETVHISDDHRRICMVETLTWDDACSG